MTTQSTVGQIIASILDERQCTQAELSDRSGLSKKHINQIIKGKTRLTADVAVKLELIFGVCALDLLYLQGAVDLERVREKKQGAAG
jgi:HTH-type transcriptional regulator/antitoxin HigA